MGGILATVAFTPFINIAIAGTGNTLVLELEFQFDADNEEFAIDNVSINGTSAIPEPTSMFLTGLAFGCVGLVRRRRVAGIPSSSATRAVC